MSLIEDDNNNDNRRLTKDEYQRPQMTYTDKLTKEEIQEKLDEYEKVENIERVNIGTHMRYFSIIDGKKKFRLGGQLINNSGLPNYVVLSNGSKQWSVQVKDTIFFKKIAIKDVKLEYIKILDYKDKIIEKQGARINELVKMVNDMKKELKEYKNATKKNTKNKENK
jgi:hypothetical protein